MPMQFRKQWTIGGCVAVFAALSLLSACAAPATSGGGPQASQQSRPAPPMSNPLPPLQVKQPPRIDSSCRTSADCAVKNVGNCCGEMPACVNKDSPVDPAAVQSQCAKRGMVGVCGFRAISACSCNAGQCEPSDANPRNMRGPTLPPEPTT